MSAEPTDMVGRVNDKLSILLIEDNPGDTRLIREMLTEVRPNDTFKSAFDLMCAARLSEGLGYLAAGQVDLLLLDLTLPDCQGLETYTQAHTFAPLVPIIVLTGLADAATAMVAVANGAQDYLVKGEVSGNLLTRAIRYAVERHRLIAEAKLLALVDDLTGLHNRRGFMVLARQQLKLMKRLNSAITIVCADLDGLKQINDTYGHAEGDRALIRAACILKGTFRESDIVARLGGDEFAVCAADPGCDHVPELMARLLKNIETSAGLEQSPCELAMSVGTACCCADAEVSLEELLAAADRAMYEQKQRKKALAR
jgi:diguanylate cyclase (GGDEF)-like protein